MFGSRTSTPTKGYTPAKGSAAPPPLEISPLAASELAIEYASLRAVGNCPTGMYITPSPETLFKWHGVFFVHHGPYAGSVLRFTILFLPTFPQSAPTVRFDSDVFHPMVDPKTKIWYPRSRLVQWQPRVHHVPHMLQSLKHSFSTSSLDGVTEDEAINKQIWSLYHYSHQTFFSMTSQRARHSVSRSTLYPSAKPLPAIPPSPNKAHARQPSSISSTSNIGDLTKVDESPIIFRELGETENKELWEAMKSSVGL